MFCFRIDFEIPDPFSIGDDVSRRPLALKLPDVETFQFGALDDLIPSEPSKSSSINDNVEQSELHDEPELEDLWSFRGVTRLLVIYGIRKL